MFLLDFLIVFLSSVSYALIFFLFIATGLGLPIPEELVLLVLGYLSAYDILTPVYALMISFVAVIVSDNLGYFIGKYNKKFIQRFIAKKRFKLAKDHMRQHGKKTLFLSRFICGLRVLFPIVAGSVGIPWKTFIVIDLSAILILVPTFFSLGYYFSSYIDSLGKFIVTLDRIVLAVVIALCVLLLFFYKRVKKRRKSIS